MANVQSIGFAADEQIVFAADLVAEGITQVALKNLDATNYVEVSLGTGGAFAASKFCKLLAGQSALIPVNKAAASDPTWYAKANTAAVNLQFVAVGT